MDCIIMDGDGDEVTTQPCQPTLLFLHFLLSICGTFIQMWLAVESVLAWVGSRRNLTRLSQKKTPCETRAFICHPLIGCTWAQHKDKDKVEEKGKSDHRPCPLTTTIITNK